MYTPLYSEFAFAAGGFPNIFERRTTKMSFAHIFRNSATSTSTESSKQYSFAGQGEFCDLEAKDRNIWHRERGMMHLIDLKWY